ncbi:hypothetical protein GLA29479_2248 [Lysobacter antibioticus]|uniref:hypothetical protein n=1 Tax=Lysobacter antibioticus TaxID=84531 RepID=UPI00071ECFEE|nr:hypothetical protein [Lysobacter antibioticus]ALN63118.1 hypothetical protein GLA29479_2248 [Lysobacter antibioticus]
MTGSTTTSFDLRAMAALLAQGRQLRALSWLLLAAALLALVVPTASPPPWPLALSLVAGLLQCYYALRVDFDARLFQAASEDEDSVRAAQRLDASLLALGLLKPGRAGRDWPARWRGARGLMVRQAVSLSVQAAALVWAYGRAWA